MQEVTYQKEKLNDVLFELIPMIQEHWDETDKGYTKAQLNPDWSIYQQLERQDSLRLFTARSGGKFVGYLSVFIRPGIHSKDFVYAITDSIFLAKDYRKDGTGKRLIQYAEDVVSDEADAFSVSMKAYIPFDHLLESLGYKMTEKVFTKEF